VRQRIAVLHARLKPRLAGVSSLRAEREMTLRAQRRGAELSARPARSKLFNSRSTPIRTQMDPTPRGRDPIDGQATGRGLRVRKASPNSGVPQASACLLAPIADGAISIGFADLAVRRPG